MKSLSHSAIRHRPSVTRSIIIVTSSERLAVRYDDDVGYLRASVDQKDQGPTFPTLIYEVNHILNCG